MEANALAGVIAHEMLHQMGHSHKSGPDGYCDDNFITVFGDLVQNRGRYIQRTCDGSTSLRLQSGEVILFPRCGL